MRAVVVVVLVSGCGRLAFDPIGTTGDAADDAVVDTLDATACTWTAFSTPVPLPGDVTTGFDEWMGTPFLGETQLMFHRYASTNSDLVVARRASTSEPFTNLTAVAELNTVQDDWTPSLSEDGLELVYARLVGNFDLRGATRTSTAMPFTDRGLLMNLSSTTHEISPWLSADGLRLMFTSERTGIKRLYESTRPTRDMPFTSPIVVELGGTASDATLSADGLEVFFASDRAGGEGGTDIWTARRAARDQPFGPATPVPELSSARDETGARLSLDGATMYVNYDTLLNGGGNANIHTATRACL